MAGEIPQKEPIKHPFLRRAGEIAHTTGHKTKDIVTHPGHSLAVGGKALLHVVTHPAHSLAAVASGISAPFVNVSQYRMFKYPETHTEKIDREMYRTFNKAATPIKDDIKTTGWDAAAIVAGAGFGEHVLLIPTATVGFKGIPLPFKLNVDVPLPLTEALNNLPFLHLPTAFHYHDSVWPLFFSNFITSAINIYFAFRANKEKRFAKRNWYALSALACYSHVWVIFNALWYELATAQAKKLTRRKFSENVGKVLSNSAETPDHKPRYKHIWHALTGQIEVDPKDRQIFVDSVERQFTNDKPREWWMTRLEENKQHALTGGTFTIEHQEKEVEENAQKAKTANIFKKLWYGAKKNIHEVFLTEAEHKVEAIDTTEKFIGYTK